MREVRSSAGGKLVLTVQLTGIKNNTINISTELETVLQIQLLAYIAELNQFLVGWIRKLLLV